jgi:lysozyme family protein
LLGGSTAFILRWNALRLRYFTSLKALSTFGAAWATRIANYLAKGAAWCRQSLSQWPSHNSRR